jgi:hypothetical protein
LRHAIVGTVLDSVAMTTEIGQPRHPKTHSKRSARNASPLADVRGIHLPELGLIVLAPLRIRQRLVEVVIDSSANSR